MSTFHAATLPAAYVEFQFGDCTPFLNDRPKKIACKQIFQALVMRDELEYQLETDDVPYVAQARSRFDDPEFVALFADILRRMATTQSVTAALRREGFHKDEKAIASVSADLFMKAAVGAAQHHTDEASAKQPRANAPPVVKQLSTVSLYQPL